MSTNSRHTNDRGGRDSFREALDQPVSKSLQGVKREAPPELPPSTAGREPHPIVLEDDDVAAVTGFAADYNRPRHHRVAHTSATPPPDDVRNRLLALIGPEPV